MNSTIRGLKGSRTPSPGRRLLALAALTGLGLLLRWVTAGSIDTATTQDLTSMAFLTIAGVAWFAYCWLTLAMLATVLEQTPGAIGRTASLVATRVTSQSSRALLRTALGAAAVTPLTIGLAHATPPTTSTTTTTQTDTTPSRPWTPTAPSSTTHPTGATPPSSRPWNSIEPRSTIQVHADTQPARSAESRLTLPLSSASPAGSRPWSSVEPRSTVELTGDSVGDWRATEAPSSVRLTEQGSATSSARTEAARAVAPRTHPSAGKAIQQHTQPTTGEASKQPSTGRAVQRGQPTARTSAAAGKPRPSGPTAVPEKSPVGRVAVPDRPTAGAATRYTDLQSGQLARPASRMVRPGESLWSIAAAELGPTATHEAIATRWPQWYAANRQLIGPDPNLIRPGQLLTPPPPSHPVPPTHQEK